MATRTTGILVRCRPNRYFLDTAAQVTHTGPTRLNPTGSGTFRVAHTRFNRDEGLPAAQRLFERVGVDEGASSDA